MSKINQYKISNMNKIDPWFEKQYTGSQWSKKHDSPGKLLRNFYNVCSSQSDEASIPCELNVSYGESEKQKIDYYFAYPNKLYEPGKPVFVYLHGGYWQEGDKEFYSFICKGFTKRGFTSAVVGYDLAPTVTISEIVNQITTSLISVNKKFGNCSLVLVGHSAGAYLCATQAANANLKNIKMLVLISGVYSLLPLLKTSFNNALKLNEDAAKELDLFKRQISADHVLIYVGGDESPESQRQSEQFYEKLINDDVKVQFNVIKNEDHFSIIENFCHGTHSIISQISMALNQ